MNSISVVVITFNEQENIGRCLQSVMDVADEIIVVDSFSTDQTKAIAEQHGARVFLRAWEGFSVAKNYGNQHASHEWILSIDADEVLSETLRQSILAFKQNGNTQGCYAVNRLTNYCGHWVRYCGWYPDQKMRMWKKKDGRWDGILHEKVVFEKNIPTEVLKGDLLHYSFPSIKHHVQTLNQYSEVAANDIVSKKKSVWFVLHVVLNPLYTFVQKYFFRLGFLDGYYGFVICILSATANFLKYSKAVALKKSLRAS